MKKFLVAILLFSAQFTHAQTIQSILNSLGKNKNNNTNNTNNGDIVQGLKEALRVGADSTTKRLSKVDGFFGDNFIKILMPPEALKAEKTLRSFGFGKTVDKAVLSMNRAAEDATKYVGQILWNAIKSMSITDALGILRGGDFAATDYLRRSTTQQLTTAFRPIIERSLQNVNATRYWSDVFSTYNKFSRTQVNTDLPAYVTDKALYGLFYHIGLQEQQIRKNPAARVTDILKKVFGS
ncbi:MAG: DUF4197 domain-containing protein [Chitinophagaceae bacterium]|nr:DUF4197 domain-containing protein [Chitinophagaceae bacterium]